MPYDREAWDGARVRYTVRPDRGSFNLSSAGTIQVDGEAITRFVPAADAQ